MEKYDIVERTTNPSVEQILKAFASGLSSDSFQMVTFSIIDHDTTTAMARKVEMLVHLQVTSLAYESGKPGMLLGGKVVANDRLVGTAKGFYDAAKKTGYLDIE
jgi:hypothetical protein